MKKEFTITLCALSGLTFADINIIEKNLVYKDEMLTLKAGSRSLKENEFHKMICQKDGAIDITDTVDIKVGKGVLDVVMCMSKNKMPDSIGSLSNIEVANLTAYAPSGHTGGGPYWAKGTVSYSNAKVGAGLAMDLGIPADNCRSFGGAGVLTPNGYSYIEVTCSYPSGINPRQSYMEAYLDGGHSIAYGTIYD